MAISPLDFTQWIGMAAVFAAVVLALEGCYLWWQSRRSAEVLRVQRRLQTWLPTAQQDAMHSLSAPASTHSVLYQWREKVGRWVWSCLTAWQRHRRLAVMSQQLPDAIDLISRAMRAGHAFTVAVQMVAQESSEPLASEFRRVHEQISLGQSADQAFTEFALRVPCDDVRFFITAVRLQRETGGNLAEVLSNLAALIRSRLRLLGKVRVLSAEGRLSAKVLAVMPLATGGLIYAARPDLMTLLWTDPMGLILLKVCIVLFALGLVWMWKIARIRV